MAPSADIIEDLFKAPSDARHRWIAKLASLRGKERYMPIQMQLSRIIISEINEQQVIYLREVDGNRQFPILIGIFEATSIDRRVKDIPRPRPLTHDLLVGNKVMAGTTVVQEGAIQVNDWFAALADDEPAIAGERAYDR